MFNHALQRLIRLSRSDRNPRVPRAGSYSFRPGVRSIPTVFMFSCQPSPRSFLTGRGSQPCMYPEVFSVS